MKISPAILALGALLSAAAAAAPAATIDVPADQSTIQAAIDAASNGDTVLVAPGTYYELLDFKGKAITVTSSGGAAVTTLDGNASGTIVTFSHNETAASVLQGFTLVHGFTSNAGFAGAIYFSSASPTIIDNVFEYNQGGGLGYTGAAIYGYGAATILRNLFADNTCGLQANSGVVVLLSGTAGVIADNVFADNPCPALIVSLGTSTVAKIYNNTIVGNRVGLNLSLYGTNASTFFSNNIIAFNQSGVQVTLVNGGTFPTWSHNLVYGNTLADYQGVADQTGSDGNLSADPVLKYWPAGDVHLLTGSAAIDAGDSSVAQASATDFYGDARVFAGIDGDSAIVDIGAAESITPDDVPGTPNIINVPADQPTIQAGIDAASVGDVVSVAPGTYYEQPDFKGKAITLKSSGGASVTILDGQGAGPIVNFVLEGSVTVLQGFTFTHAKVGSGGGAINLSGPAAPTIMDDIFEGNYAYGGPAISMFGGAGSPTILRNRFVDNVCSNSDDDPSQAVVEFEGDSPTIADNVFVNNTCPALYIGAGSVYNNTMVGNQQGIISPGASKSAPMSFSNNLIAFNNYGLSQTLINGAVMAGWSHNLVYGNTTADYSGVTAQTGSNGNISVDPQLRDWANADVSLLYGSPAIDVGNSSVSQASATDFFGAARVFAGMPGDAARVDMGATEYEPPSVAATAGSISAPFDGTAVGTLASSGADPAEPLVFALASLPAHGSVTLTDAATGAFDYVPNKSYLGPDHFTFQVTDPYGSVSNTATEQVSVAHAGATANSASVDTTPDMVAVGTLTATPSYPGQLLIFSLVSNPTHGTASINSSNGKFRYQPVLGYAGTDSFSFEVKDASGAASNVATVSVQVNDIAATAHAVSIVLRSKTAFRGILKASTAYLGQTLSFAVVTQPKHGSVTLIDAQTGAYTYTPDASFKGTDSFTFKAVDQWGTASNVATLSFSLKFL